MKDVISALLGGGVIASSGLAVDGKGVVTLLASLGCLLWIYNQAKSAFGKKSSLPQPLTVEFQKSLASKDEVEELREEMRRSFDEDRRTSRVAIGNVHRRIDEEVKVVGEMKGELKSIADNVQMILNKLM